MGASAPILTFGHTEPTLLLQEVKEHDLAHELLGEVHGADVLLLEFVSDGFVFGREFFQRLVNLSEQLGVFVEELPSDGLDAEGVFDLRERRIVLRVLQQAEKAGLRGVATLALAHDVGEAASGRQARLDADATGLGLDGGILHLDVGEPPLPFGGRDERDEGSVFFVAGLEMVGNEITNSSARALQLRLLC